MSNESAAHATSCNELLLGPFRQAFIVLWIINLIPLFFQMFGYHDRGMRGHYHDLLNEVSKDLVLAEITAWINERIPAVKSEATLT